MTAAQILSAEQIRTAEQALFDAGMSDYELMDMSGRSAAEWIRRLATERTVTVLCGPGNNGGDGYVIARHLREAGNTVQVVGPVKPKSSAAQEALKAWGGPIQTSGTDAKSGVLVDCLFGTGLTRALSGEHALLLRDLAQRHSFAVAVDLPSGISSDDGTLLNEKLPAYDVTLALGVWKFAHWSQAARLKMGLKRLVPIGIGPVQGAAQLLRQPELHAPADNTHKYKRGFAVIVAGEMEGAVQLSAEAALRAGAGYVKAIACESRIVWHNPALVVEASNVDSTLNDRRISAVLIGPGLGRSERAYLKLLGVLKAGHPSVIDADALMLLKPGMLGEKDSILATPHDGELEALCKSFCVIAQGRKARALALAKTSGMVVLAKGPVTYIAAPDGRLVIAPPASSWLSTAGSGDVLAGVAVSRMASGKEAFDAACEAVWLQGETARKLGAAFTALELAQSIPAALKQCL